MSTDLSSFSFHKNPVLVVENFWSPEERQFFRQGMDQAEWRSLSDLPKVISEYHRQARGFQLCIHTRSGVL